MQNLKTTTVGLQQDLPYTIHFNIPGFDQIFTLLSLDVRFVPLDFASVSVALSTSFHN
jgi:hypothetical protein